MTMLEKVTNSIAAKLAERGAIYSDCEALARAALEALKDPSPAMLDAAQGAGCKVLPSSAWWHAMIDAALNEK